MVFSQVVYFVNSQSAKISEPLFSAGGQKELAEVDETPKQSKATLVIGLTSLIKQFMVCSVTI